VISEIRLALRVIGFGAAALPLTAPAAEEPIWAKQAIVLDLSCSSVSRIIESPDHRSSIQVLCRRPQSGDPIYFASGQRQRRST